MEADCAHKLPGRPLCGTTECETGLFVSKLVKLYFTNIIFIISS